jgi:tetratricopeptide (TPR) repeat protein
MRGSGCRLETGAPETCAPTGLAAQETDGRKRVISAGVSTEAGTEEGLERLRAVARSNPRSTAFVALAHALCDLGRDEEAEEVCRQGLLQHPRLVTGQVALGRALMGRGRFGEAKEALVSATKTNPEHGDAFRLLGDLVMREGDVDRARAILEYAEELLPNDTRVAELLVKAGGKPSARLPRPSSDFEHTMVKDARALAERMLEDPPAPAASNGAATVDEDRTPVVEPLNQFDLAGTPTPAVPVNIIEEALRPPGPDAAPNRFAWRALALAAVVGVVVALVLVVAFDRPRRGTSTAERAAPRAPEVTPASRASLDLAPLRLDILDGGVERLQKVRAAGKQTVLSGPESADLAALVAFADALLAADWGATLGAEAMLAADVAERARPASPARTATLESARALTAAANGRLVDARAAAERALAAASTSYEARLASGRVKFLAGELGAARVDLERALDAAPDFTAAALDHAAVLIDAGEAAASAAELEKQVGRRAGDLRARLLLSEAGRAAARPVEGAPLRAACREQGAAHPPLRALCALEAASAARLEGDRSGAGKNARAAAVTGVMGLHAARGTASAALLLASLGDIDAASETLDKVIDHVGSSFAPRVWAQAAIALGRGEKVTSAALATPPSPEARLVAARMAFVQGGPAALASILGRIGTAAVEYDPDLKSYSALALEGRLSGRLKADLEKRAVRGNAVASYVVGRNALQIGDRRTAARRLARALKGHGDVCEAARLLQSIERRYRPNSVSTDAKVATALKGRSSACIHLRR